MRQYSLKSSEKQEKPQEKKMWRAVQMPTECEENKPVRVKIIHNDKELSQKQ